MDDKGKIKDFGYSGRALMGSTTVKVGPVLTSRRSAYPPSKRSPRRARTLCASLRPLAVGTGVPAPRRVRRKPFVQWQAPLVWTTLTLTI